MKPVGLYDSYIWNELDVDVFAGLFVLDCVGAIIGYCTVRHRGGARTLSGAKVNRVKFTIQRLAESASAFLHLRVLSAHGLPPRLVSILSGPESKLLRQISA